MEASELATITPSPPAGAMNPSPLGRLPNAPRAVRSPSSGMPWRPRRSSRRSVPRGQVTCASSPRSSRSATAWQRLASASKSTAMSRASMSAVMPGSVAPRAPASVAALRACVCESERVVGAMKTADRGSAAATGGGGSVPSVARSSMSARTASAPARAAASRSSSPIARVPASAITRTSSPGFTPRLSRTTVSTARSRSPAMGRRLRGDPSADPRDCRARLGLLEVGPRGSVVVAFLATHRLYSWDGSRSMGPAHGRD